MPSAEPEDATIIIEPSSIPISLPRQMPDVTGVATQTVSNPKAMLLATKFPQYLCSAVTKYGDTAVVTMAFPSQLSSSRIACLLSLSILPNKVQHFAKELYRINLESDGDFRSIVQDNGVRIIPNGDLVLQGVQDKAAMLALLGSEASDGIEKSPQREEEVRQGIIATSCVTLRITGRSREVGILNLNLGLEKGFQWRDELFKE
jgi:hypothetical protein